MGMAVSFAHVHSGHSLSKLQIGIPFLSDIECNSNSREAEDDLMSLEWLGRLQFLLPFHEASKNMVCHETDFFVHKQPSFSDPSNTGKERLQTKKVKPVENPSTVAS